MYSKWRMHISESMLKDKTKSYTKHAVDNAKKEIEIHWKSTLYKATEKMNKEKSTYIDETELKVLKERKALSIIAKADMKNAAEEERARLLILMKEKEADWTKREKELSLIHQNSISRITKENNKNIELIHKESQKEIKNDRIYAEVSLKEQHDNLLNENNQKWGHTIEEMQGVFEKEKITR